MHRQRIDPASVLVGDFAKRAVGADCDHATVVAAGEKGSAVADGDEDRRAWMGADALQPVRFADQHSAIGERQRRSVAEEHGRDDIRPCVERTNALGE